MSLLKAPVHYVAIAPQPRCSSRPLAATFHWNANCNLQYPRRNQVITIVDN
ncbi:uncharacterized protein CLUP02_15926 [Colletotrichum lupini]|uniref:Uncharacterized protein n=1 Tax=Colletotrichum lupini TaxID=145971 RepID=A0A9Q8WP66_9PEZI|nr:uncharacterized protein CLUP02_15926 [Colletotrichum lupini]UQC90396.1 hypothetical protein CLUP02_15926 [Colletotrichum lupini]